MIVENIKLFDPPAVALNKAYGDITMADSDSYMRICAARLAEVLELEYFDDLENELSGDLHFHYIGYTDLDGDKIPLLCLWATNYSNYGYYKQYFTIGLPVWSDDPDHLTNLCGSGAYTPSTPFLGVHSGTGMKLTSKGAPYISYATGQISGIDGYSLNAKVYKFVNGTKVVKLIPDSRCGSYNIQLVLSVSNLVNSSGNTGKIAFLGRNSDGTQYPIAIGMNPKLNMNNTHSIEANSANLIRGALGMWWFTTPYDKDVLLDTPVYVTDAMQDPSYIQGLHLTTNVLNNTDLMREIAYNSKTGYMVGSLGKNSNNFVLVDEE